MKGTTLLLLAHQTQAAPPSSNWIDDFQAFSALHIMTVVVFGAAMVGACVIGRRCGYETERERRFRVTWGWIVLVYQTWYSAWYLMPSRFDWRDSLPLQVCDLAAFVAGLAMVSGARVWRTLLYFWGIGLSTQAFFTPTVQYGIGHLKFWMFWIGHTMIVGSAVYDLVVRGYRPRLRDLGTALAITYSLCLTAFFFDVLMTRQLGYPINYWYIGETKPDAPTILDGLGPWPLRVAAVMGIVITEFVLLWAVWPVLGWLRAGGRVESGPAPASPASPPPRAG
jgi:hypothetical integral membrane protein (TIGR02206 family)